MFEPNKNTKYSLKPVAVKNWILNKISIISPPKTKIKLTELSKKIEKDI